VDLLREVPQTSPVIVHEEAPPGGKRARIYLPAYAPCPHCGLLVLAGVTDTNEEVALNPHQRCYAILWQNNAPQPELRVSGAYPVHQCSAGAPQPARRGG
jgi:hypothetical protein